MEPGERKPLVQARFKSATLLSQDSARDHSKSRLAGSSRPRGDALRNDRCHL
jgi:hypothetical protein